MRRGPGAAQRGVWPRAVMKKSGIHRCALDAVAGSEGTTGDEVAPGAGTTAALAADAGCALRHAVSSATSYQWAASFSIGHSPLIVLPARCVASFTVACAPSSAAVLMSASVRLFATSRP